MSIRPNLISWQWSDYSSKHLSHINCYIHIVAVPLFWLGSLLFVYGLFTPGSRVYILYSLLSLVVSIVLQGIGHKQEKNAPAPFLSGVDWASRFVVEQFVNFPRFVITGQWQHVIKQHQQQTKTQ